MTEAYFSILLIEDCDADAAVVKTYVDAINLRAGSEDWPFFSERYLVVERVTSVQQAAEYLEEQQADLILSDLSLPDSSGMETVAKLRTKLQPAPIVVLSGSDRIDDAFQAVSYGAQDYLVKGHITDEQLARSIRYAYERFRVQVELDSASQHKSMFLAQMSHELRTPLTAIQGFAELLENRQLSADKVHEAAGIILRNTRHLVSLVDDVLELSKIEAGKMPICPETWPLHEIIESVRSVMIKRSEHQGVTFSLIQSEAIPEYAVLDPKRTKQILTNVVGNAIKYTPQGSVELVIGFNKEQKELLFKVSDTGIGIEAGLQEKIFEPFVRGESQAMKHISGSGLGLAVTKRLLDELGGDIEIRSEPGRGTTVSVTMPVELPTQLSEPVVDGKLETVRLSGKILVAEDSADNVRLLEHILEDMGLTFTMVNDGEAAVRAAQDEEFDAILMDMQMPGMDGFEATRALREAKCRTPIIALTAYAIEGSRDKCLEAGCSDYLNKPFNQDSLFAKLKSVIHRNGAPAEQRSKTQSQQKPVPKHIISGFLGTVEEKMGVLRDACAQRDYEKVGKVAHQLANADMFLPDSEIGHFARMVEEALFLKDEFLLEHKINDLFASCRRTLERWQEQTPAESENSALKATETKIIEAEEQKVDESAGMPKRVLLVEDCVHTSAYISMVLREWGFTVDVAQSGKDAIDQACTQHKDFSHVLIDIGLPDVSGYELATYLRTNGVRKPLIAISGWASLGRQKEAVHAGFDAFLAKRNIEDTLPWKMSELAKP